MTFPFKHIAVLVVAILFATSVSAQISQVLPGTWDSDYMENKDLYSLTLKTSFSFSADGTYSQTGRYKMTFHGKDHGTCDILVRSRGQWSVEEQKLFFEPQKGATTAEMSDVRMSKALEGIFRSTVLPKMIRRYTSRRHSIVRSISHSAMVLIADDGRAADYVRSGMISL